MQKSSTLVDLLGNASLSSYARTAATAPTRRTMDQRPLTKSVSITVPTEAHWDKINEKIDNLKEEDLMTTSVTLTPQEIELMKVNLKCIPGHLSVRPKCLYELVDMLDGVKIGSGSVQFYLAIFGGGLLLADMQIDDLTEATLPYYMDWLGRKNPDTLKLAKALRRIHTFNAEVMRLQNLSFEELKNKRLIGEIQRTLADFDKQYLGYRKDIISRLTAAQKVASEAESTPVKSLIGLLAESDFRPQDTIIEESGQSSDGGSRVSSLGERGDELGVFGELPAVENDGPNDQPGYKPDDQEEGIY